MVADDVCPEKILAMKLGSAPLPFRPAEAERDLHFVADTATRATRQRIPTVGVHFYDSSYGSGNHRG
jgi:hypothetical protein